MTNSRLANWTRRRFGLTTGGVALSLVGLGGNQGAGARKKRKRKNRKTQGNCVTIGQPCDPGNGACCGNAACELFDGVSRCCVDGNAACSNNAECCGRICFEGACVIR